MRIIIKYERTDIYKLSNIVTSWADNEKPAEKNTDELIDLIASGEIWQEIDGLPENWEILEPEDAEAVDRRGTAIASITAYELDDEGDYDVNKPLARTERAIAEGGK